MIKIFLKHLIRLLIIALFFVVMIWVLIARPFSTQSPGLGHDIDPQFLAQQVRHISEDYFPRDSTHPENLNALSEYLFQFFKQHSNAVEFQTFTVDGNSYRNVLARFGPETKQRVVVGAHYDAFGSLPAADDNASGVAGLMALAQLLSQAELSMSIELVAYTLEEPPHFASENMGSYRHAKSLFDAGVDIKLMISLEMIGYFTDEPDSQQYPVPFLDWYYPTEGNFIAVVDQLMDNNALTVKSAINQYSDVEAFSINAPAMLTGVDFSDHRNYWAFDYPAVMVTDTAFFRNQAYHTEQDTHDRLDYQKMAGVVFAVFKYLENIN